ncbi:DUF5372 family protein [Singulisphaera sp. GP187]|uniref:DUF5372 family protein n=1 Tax=Singulisphaera sp. GP187 TaxID=1882752 RepID=UPI0039656FAD
MVSNARWELECQQHTTPSSQPSLGFVTITHPHHPLHGQKVEVVQLRRGIDPDLIVRLPDGHHAAIAMSGTDYASPPEGGTPPRPDHLLDLDGLRQARLLLDRVGCPATGHARQTHSATRGTR